MTDELLAYLMDDLPLDRRAAIERNLAIDPAWRRELERLQQCLAANAEPPCGPQQQAEPPTDLVKRTCSLVESSCGPERGSQRAADPGAGHCMGGATSCGRRSRWSLADVAIGVAAAGLLGLLFAPSLLQSREAARSLACQNNLRWLGTQAFDFQERWDQLLPPVEAHEHAGAYATKLVELGGVDRRELAEHLRCPGALGGGEARMMVIPTHQQLNDSFGKQRLQLVQQADGVYAIRMGHFDQQDVYHLPRFTGCENKPLLADAPDPRRTDLGSLNHPGGQHVLFEALNVRFVSDCELANRDELYKNDAGYAAAGCDPDDAVLSPGTGSPMGPILTRTLYGPPRLWSAE